MQISRKNAIARLVAASLSARANAALPAVAGDIDIVPPVAPAQAPTARGATQPARSRIAVRGCPPGAVLA